MDKKIYGLSQKGLITLFVCNFKGLRYKTSMYCSIRKVLIKHTVVSVHSENQLTQQDQCCNDYARLFATGLLQLKGATGKAGTVNTVVQGRS